MPLSVFYILSTSILLNLILGVIILSNNIRNKINILFGLFSIGTILWNFAILGFFFIKLPEGIAHSFWINLSHFSAAFIALIFINFCTYFPQPLISCKNKNKLISIISAIPFLIIFYFLSFSNLIIGEVNKIAYELGSLYIPYTLYLSSCFLLGLIILIVQYKKSKENIQKTQIKYVLVGTVLPLILATITDAILPYLGVFKYTWIGPVFIFIMVGSIAYSILKHHLFDTRIVVTEILTLVINVFAFYQIFLSKTSIEYGIRILFFSGVLIISILLIRGVINDLHRREELQQLTKKLEIANVRLKALDQAKTEFISIASHQLRTPLSFIKGNVSMLLEGIWGKLSDKQSEELKKVYNSNENLIKLVDDLLDISRIESGRMKYTFQPVSLEEVVKNVFEETEPLAKKKGLKINFKKPQEPLPKVKADRLKISQVVLNLIDNAVKYTKKGSINIKLEQRNNKVVFSVKDTGIGIKEEEKETLFQKFTRGKEGSKSNTKGTGLGLYLCSELVKAHGGEIWTSSKGEGEGSIFMFELPIEK